MRVYVPSTVGSLRALVESGVLGQPPLRGHAVTPALIEAYGEADLEEYEWAASGSAEIESLQLLAGDPGQPPRRVVVPVDVPDDAVRADADAGPSDVHVTAVVQLSDVASVHVDAAEAEPAVRAALAALPAYAAGDRGAAADALEALDEHALEWYATQELPDLLAGLRS